MFCTPDYFRPIGQISDYSLAPVMKAKSLNFYVKDVPMILDEAIKHNSLLLSIPMGLPYGVRTRVWSVFFPDTQFLGEMVSYSVITEGGQAVEIMTPYAEFDITTVPWEDLVA